MSAPVEVAAMLSGSRERRILADIPYDGPPERPVIEQPFITSTSTQHAGAAMAAHAALGLISGKWTVDVLLALRERPLRFGMLKRELDHIARKVLTQTLRCMQRDGLIWRRATGTLGKPVEYGLTPVGTSLLDCVTVFAGWSTRHMSTVETARAHFDAEAP